MLETKRVQFFDSQYTWIIFWICRYVESAQCLSRETNLDMNKYEVCDNVSLETVLMEYMAYYRVKFNKDPKITKKLTNPQRE